MEVQGRSLRRLRQLHGMKQSHLAEIAGVAQTTVSRWEGGLLAPSQRQADILSRLFAPPPAPGHDAALKRLVQSSMARIHLICDASHRLLAASPARSADWRGDVADFLGRSLLVYATPEIRAAEASLRDRAWFDGGPTEIEIETGANGNSILPIRRGRLRWERIRLSDGTAARLVTTLA